MNWASYLWLGLTAVFLLVEASTVTLVSVWFAAGSLAAIVVALLGGSLGLQVAVCLTVAIILLLSMRGLVRRHFTPNLVATNVDTMAGREGLVVVPVDNLAARGQVTISGMEWTARSTSGKVLEEGTKVTVDRVEGVKVFVSAAE